MSTGRQVLGEVDNGSTEFGPRLANRHLVAEFIEGWQRRGRIKRCAHLDIAMVGVFDLRKQFAPQCQKDSFDVEWDPTDPRHPWQFYGCPARCHFYLAPWRARLRSFVRQLHPIRWFDAQPLWVKIALLALPAIIVALLRGPETLQTLGDIITKFMHK